MLAALEKSLSDIFVKQAPELPRSGKKALVEYLPWANLILGLLALLALYGLWHWAHLGNGLINYADSLSSAYGVPAATAHRLTFGIWLGVLVLILEAGLYLMAFPATRDRKKSGWNLMFYALLVNIVYGLIMSLTSYGGFGSLVGALIGSTIGLYLLFQIRPSYSK
ncbi:MAG TPA: hypothetical protein VIJ68_01750 [Candidatus Saccharimonadales bacterium]